MFIKWNKEKVDMVRSSGAVCHQDPRYLSSQVQVKLSFIVIPLHVGTYSGTKCRASQDHGAT